MLITSRSPRGGNPIRTWVPMKKKAESNIKVGEYDSPRVTEESYFCIKIGYLNDGSEALVKDADAYNLYRLLKRHYRRV